MIDSDLGMHVKCFVITMLLFVLMELDNGEKAWLDDKAIAETNDGARPERTVVTLSKKGTDRRT